MNAKATAGYKTKRGQFYASLTAMPAHERDTAKRLYEFEDEREPSAAKADAERWRKLRAAIIHLGRLPTSLAAFISATAGSNAQGLDEAVDQIKDYRG